MSNYFPSLQFLKNNINKIFTRGKFSLYAKIAPKKKLMDAKPKSFPNENYEESEIKKGIFLQPSIYINGRYKNPWPTGKHPSYGGIFRFIFLEKNINRIDQPYVLDAKLPIVSSNWIMPENGVNITWIGHATVVVEFDGISVLTDPIFSDRASPVSFLGPNRYRPPACKIQDLPEINAVVISHNHYDHLDLQSVEKLNQRFGNKLYWFVPMGLKRWFQEVHCTNVIELAWWQSASIPEHDDIKFVLTPSQHWCKRGLNDDNTVLWGSWSVIGPNHRFFFAGDTGYCESFKQIGAMYGPFDVAAIPIGAYEPRWFMKNHHVDPEEAVCIHEDIKSKFSVGIHWGTFALAHEHYLDPPIKLQESLTNKHLPLDSFVTLKHGESKLLED